MATRIVASMNFEEYMATSFRPDREWVDGQLKERTVGKFDHSFVQAWLAHWFREHRGDYNATVLVEQRTQVGPEKVRIPDVLLVERGPQPDVIVAPPILAVEILSPGDTFSDTARRANDYLRMGAAAVWIIDPEMRIGLVFTGSLWRELEVMTVPGTRIEVSLAALWQDLDREKGLLS